VLRHPVERVISFYFYKKARDGGFESVARQRDNTQTRILAGMVPYAGPSTRVTPSALDDAKANLLEHVELLLAERFDESLILAKRRLGWDRLFYWPRNVTRRPSGSGISDHFRRRIEADNAYDLELYGFAQGLFRLRPGSVRARRRRAGSLVRHRVRGVPTAQCHPAPIEGRWGAAAVHDLRVSGAAPPGRIRERAARGTERSELPRVQGAPPRILLLLGRPSRSCRPDP